MGSPFGLSVGYGVCLKSKMQKIKEWDKCEADNPEGRSRISVFWSIIYAALAIGFYFLLYWNWSTLPSVVIKNDDNPDKFNAENAQSYLKAITDIGPRVGGSFENEVLAIKLLLNILDNIQNKSKPIHKIDVDVQIASGFVNIPKKYGYPVTLVFTDIQNVVVKLTAFDQDEPSNYLLLNAHFDSVSGSPGAGDDATMCAVMLEILRKMSQSTQTHKHGIVFLFNGYEENNLQGSYAFISAHEWFKKVRAVINMEATSTTGQILMFQSGPDFPFLIDYYSKIFSRPYSTAIAEEVFQAGFVPSSTDYEMFVDYGKIPGLDFAFNQYGYLYHTKYDTYDKIPIESIQQAGQNILHLTHALANASELYDMEAYFGGKAVFFDVLNWFMVTYSEVVASIIHSFMLILSVSLVFISLAMIAQTMGVSYKIVAFEFLMSFIILVVCIVVGAGLSILVSIILDAVGRSMSWFTSTWLLFGIYYLPFLIIICLGPLVYVKFRKVKYLEIQSRVIIFLTAEQLVHILILLTMTALGTQTAYLFSLTTFAYSITNLVNIFLRFKKYHWIYVHLLGQIISFSYSASITFTIFSTFVAMAGRGDSTQSQDLRMAVLCVLSAFLMFGFVNSLVCLMRRPFYFLALLTLYFLINLIVVFTPVGFPFREGTTPQRFYLHHSERIFYNYDGSIRKQDSKIHMQPQDMLTPSTIMDYVPAMKEATLLGDECKTEVYCGIPYYLNSQYKQSSMIYWLPFGKPNFPLVPILNMTDKQTFGPRTSFNFTIWGVDHLGFYISPFKECKLTEWSFGDVLHSGPLWEDRSVHYVNYVYGKDVSEGEFYLVIEHPIGMGLTEPILTFMLEGQYMHHEEYRTAEYTAFIDSFPDFAHVVAYQSHLQSWLF